MEHWGKYGEKIPAYNQNNWKHWLHCTCLVTVETTCSCAHTGTVRIWGWMSWSHFQFLHGCWRRCREPWRLRGRQTFDRISTSTGFNYFPVLLQVKKTGFLKASQHQIHVIPSFIYKNKPSSTHRTATKCQWTVTQSPPVCPWWRLWSVPPAETVRWSSQW